jgi:peptidoglycan/LPS O-acetylase OafA/YrhL
MATVPRPAAIAGSRFHELDSIRGLAALIVVFHHFLYMWFYSQTGRTDSRSLIWYPLIAGHESVILFFLLSGFVLSVPYLRGSGQSYPIFMVRRLLRIYCPYLFALALAVAANAVWHGKLSMGRWSDATWATPVDAKEVWQSVLMLGDYNWQRFNTAFWSLVEEMRISIIFPFLFVFVRKTGTWVTLLTAALCSLVIHLVPGAGQDTNNMVHTLQYVTVFLCGILMAVHMEVLAAWYGSLGRLGRVALVTSSFLLFELGHLASLDVWRGGWRVREWDVRDWPVIVGAGGLLLIGLQSKYARIFLNSAVPRFLGRISYSLYLVHATVLFALAFLPQDGVPRAVAFLIYLPTTLLLSTIFCILIEEPFMQIGRRFSPSRRKVPAFV